MLKRETGSVDRLHHEAWVFNTRESYSIELHVLCWSLSTVSILWSAYIHTLSTRCIGMCMYAECIVWTCSVGHSPIPRFLRSQTTFLLPIRRHQRSCHTAEYHVEYPANNNHHHGIVRTMIDVTDILHCAFGCMWACIAEKRLRCVHRETRFSEIVLLFHTPTIVKILGMVGLSFR